MNRLQKKCVIATVGLHLLLLAILIVGPAFYSRREQPDNLQVLDVIPANLVDAALDSGVRNAQPPAPTPKPIVAQSQPTPPAPKPVEPSPSLMTKVEKFFKPEPVKPVPDSTPIEKSEKSHEHKIQVNTKLVTRTESKNLTPTKSRDNSQEKLRAAVRNATLALKKNFSPSTTVEMPGDSSVAYANYASVVKSIYEQAWLPPDNTASDDANVKVIVTIASDGTVVSAHIIAPSGDDNVDNSIQRTLDRVTVIRPFPEGSTDKQRTYTINFNLKAKRTLE